MNKELALETIKTFVANTDNAIMKGAILALHPELSESEDERIRKELWEYFHDLQLSSDRDFSPSFTIDDILAYLERQKGQKPLSTEETELNSIAFLEQMGYTCIPPGKKQKQAEWGEEDELMRNAVLNTLERIGDYGTIGMQKDWLKSLPSRFNPQPHWKPSEEQMEALECAERWYSDNMGCNPYLYQLLCDLKNFKNL